MRKRFTRSIAAASALAIAMLQTAFLPPDAMASDVPDFSYLGAVGTLTEEQTIAAAESIYESLAAHKDFADFSEKNITPISPTTENIDSLMKVFVTVIGGWEVGVLAKKNDSSCLLRGNANSSQVVGMSIYYWVPDEEYDAVYSDVTAQLDAITADVDPAWSAPEKALYLHEYMAIHYNYDYDALSSTLSTDEEKLAFTAYGMLKHNKAVCEGYAWLYSILLRRVGVDNMTVVSRELGHAWNLLNIDGSWYHVDVTWDDSNNDHPGLVKHDSFLKNQSAMVSSGHTSNDWTLTTGKLVSELPVSNKYNNCFWNKLPAVVQYYQGQWLAIQPEDKNPTTGWFNLYSFDAATGEAEVTTIASQSQRWSVWGQDSHYYAANYIIPSVNSGTIFYTTPTSIMAYRNNSHIWICNLTEEQQQLGYIYGMYTEGDTLYYSVSQKYYDPAEIFTIDLTEYRDRISTEDEAASSETSVTETTTAEATTEMTETTLAPESTTAPETSASETTVITEATEESTETDEISSEAESVPEETAETSEIPETTTSEETTSTTSSVETTTVEETTSTSETTTVSETTAPRTPDGDADGDGTVSMIDYVILYRYLTGSLKITTEQAEAIDLCRDGCIDIFDLAILKRILLHNM